ncbi:hypothetical protein [Actinoplanes sp. HUAS TT8]|uniref:hypothetical protein n=1 Tax=Actinoplanes sp. HUAS TT8 TaxID=3447453 RepID=UPI003F52361A
MEFGGRLYEIDSWYCLPENAWHYELSGLSGAPGVGPYLTFAIPDVTPDGAFTPSSAQHVVVRFGGGVAPWPVLQELIGRLDSSGDLVDEERDLSAGAIALPLTLNTWSHGCRRFEVNHFHNDDSWCYELYEVDTDATGNNYIAVRIPDAPETPGDHVVLTMHGRWTVPWAVFRRFLDAIRAADGW